MGFFNFYYQWLLNDKQKNKLFQIHFYKYIYHRLLLLLSGKNNKLIDEYCQSLSILLAQEKNNDLLFQDNKVYVV